jgi:hypothetical protein
LQVSLNASIGLPDGLFIESAVLLAPWYQQIAKTIPEQALNKPVPNRQC